MATAMAELSGPGILARLERIPVGRWHLKVRVVLAVALFFDAFDLLAISFALPAFVNEWRLTPAQVGWVLSAAFFGQFIGAIVAGWLADRYGRVMLITTATALYALMSLGCAFAWGPQALMAFRFLAGVGLGAEVPVSNTYISELAKTEKRGRFYVLFQVTFPFGLIAAALLGYLLVPRLGWQAMFYIGTLPIFLVMFLPRLVPESPRWLVSRGRITEADTVVSKVERIIVAEGKQLPEPAPAKAAATREAMRWQEIFAPAYLRRTISVWVMWFCCFSTTYGLQSWLPTLYRTRFHLDVAHSNLYGLITQCCGILGTIMFALTTDRFGRRPLFMVAFCGGAVTLLTLSGVGATTAQTLLVFISIGAFFMSTGSMGLNLFTSEIYPTRVRAFGGAVGGAWQRVAAFVGPLVVGYLAPSYGLGPVFIYFGGLAAIGAIVTYIFAVETRGRTLEELSR